MTMTTKVTTHKSTVDGKWHVYVEAEHTGAGGKVYLDLPPGTARDLAEHLIAMADDCDERTREERR